MTEFKFNPAAVTPLTQVVVESKPVIQGSPEERISAARAKSMDVNRHNAKSNPGMPQLPPEHFQDTGHGSPWLAKHLLFLATELQTSIEGKRIPLGATGNFSPRTGKFNDLGFHLSDLLKALHARVQELGISMAKLEEYSATIHTLQEDREFNSMTFEERCALWKEPS